MLRQLEPQWNYAMILASLAISLLGAFTSTQLMCQARMSLHFSSVLAWTILGSLTFGFCSIWSLHFVATLACELDLPIGINVPLTVLSSVLAVFFTFTALASDLLWDRYNRGRAAKSRQLRRKLVTELAEGRQTALMQERSHKRLLEPVIQEEEYSGDDSGDTEWPFHDGLDRQIHLDAEENASSSTNSRLISLNSAQSPDVAVLTRGSFGDLLDGTSPDMQPRRGSWAGTEPLLPTSVDGIAEFEDSPHETLSEHSASRRSSSFMGSNGGSNGLSNLINVAHRKTSPAKNAFVAMGEALYTGCTRKNIIKGLFWSIAITSMHYSGIAALCIPAGYVTHNIPLVVLSGLISWAVCLVGCILMAQMETHLAQQFLFSIVATIGVAGMHFTGMRAITFWSHAETSGNRGYPPALAVAIASIAIITCIAANGLLAHSATVSRNKLAEIVWTRRKLWRTLAQKENAEAAAAARSEFIASASHEIRTPLHHLQGYSDLLARTNLSDEGRLLLCAIQRATKTLSLITNNVLDWSKLESDAEATCRPVALEIRQVLESIMVLLPNKDDEADVEVLVVVAPDVPHSLLIDETYIHRILMNLLSNALKFTRFGYILVLIEMHDGKLIATVKDTGCGVPPGFLPQLFEPFKQAQTRSGSQRGTGLGLSIIKQLVHKMGGTIDVQSIHPETDEMALDQTGSTFTVTVPIQLSSPIERESLLTQEASRIAIFHSDNERCVEGIRTAWEKFEYEVVLVKEISDLSDYRGKYIWADLSFLKQNQAHLHQLADQDRWIILVPYDTQNMLQQVPQVLSGSRFIPLPKPLMWHSFQQRIAAASQPLNGAVHPRTVRFASKVDILVDDMEFSPETPVATNLVILLVEDNPINQKLGKKMLTSLGYQVLVADNGQEAIEQILEHDTTIDAILMDQSMPRKDGITATKEIRFMEAAGALSKRRPIIAVTAVVNPQTQALFKSAGADDFLAKPLSMSRLEQILTAHLPGKWK